MRRSSLNGVAVFMAAAAGACGESGSAPDAALNCPVRTADCNALAQDGCEVDLESPATCGSCHHACAAFEVCVEASVCECPAELTTCDGACADLLRDPVNCGVCGHTCSSGGCGLGACGAAQIGGVSGAVASIAADGTSVFAGTFGVAFGASGGIFRVDRLGGKPVMLAPAEHPNDMTADDTWLYWADHGSSVGVSLTTIARVPKAGGAVELLLMNGYPFYPNHLRVVDGDVYFTTSEPTGVRVWRQATGLIEELAALPAGTSERSAGLVVNGDTLYWLISYSSTGYETGRIVSLPRTGGAPMTLVDDVHAYALAGDAESIYWLTDFGHEVWSMPLAGGTPVLLAGVEQSYRLYAWGDFLYVASSNGAVLRVSKIPGPVRILPGPSYEPFLGTSLAFDDLYLYWVNYTVDGDTLHRYGLNDLL